MAPGDEKKKEPSTIFSGGQLGDEDDDADHGHLHTVLGDDEVRTLQVIVEARGQSAELEIQRRAFASVAELRALILNTLPEMFSPSDSVMLEYKDRRGKWSRVKTRTSVTTLNMVDTIMATIADDTRKVRLLTKKAYGSHRGRFQRLDADEHDET